MAPSDSFQWIGATIDGKYRVDAVVGEGGFGVVYRAHHLGFDEPVAVKCLKIPREMTGADREAFQRKFVEEGKLLHRLSRATAGIVQALDVGAVTSPSGAWTPYLVLEWLNGVALDRDLAERRVGGLRPRALLEAIALLAPAARALEAAHAQGVAHRDIKPANLFLAEIGAETTLKVLDFGIAKVLSELTSMTQAMAETGSSVKAFTPQYGAPEQFHRRFGATGPWTDVFALALVLIEVASGRAALDGGDTTQLFIASTDPTFRPSLKQSGVDAPDAVEAVVRRALAVDPRARYHHAGELWDALEAALAGVAPGPAKDRSGTPRTAPMLSPDMAAMPTGEYLDAAVPDGGRPARSVATSVGTAGAAQEPPAFIETPPPGAQRSPGVGNAPAPGEAAFNGPVVPMVARPATAPRGPALIIGIGVAVAFLSISAVYMLLGLSRPPPPPPLVNAQTVTATPSAPAVAPPVPPEMVRLLPGKLRMGSELGGRAEKPVHEVTLTKAFDIDRNEATVADYQRCVRAGKCTESSVHGPRVEASDVDKRGSLCTALDPAKGDHPITCIDREQAAAYCAWAGKRLPTEAEWEYAARGEDGRDYPWGNAPADCEHANVSYGNSCKRPRATLPVGSLPAGASAAGALDMAGNTWEWVADGWDPDIYAKGAQTDPLVPATGDKGVLRGGSWDFSAAKAKSTARLPFDHAAGDAATGVRCARTVALSHP